MSPVEVTSTRTDPCRMRVSVSGTVQGVGFRPFVYRLAHSLGLGGFVRNDSVGVAIEVEGQRTSVERFLSMLVTDAPQHARIGGLQVGELAPAGDGHSFAVEASTADGATRTSIAPDLAVCDACLRELFDGSNRRYRYPFINCTNCGPRFTIAQRIPYDRTSTTMAAFQMCDGCRREYDDPMSRRFHAQPNACPSCGPRVALVSPSGAAMIDAQALDTVHAAARALGDGAILAVKGLGGYHLACRADDSRAVRRLRIRKKRDEKPFAVMVASLEGALALADIGPPEARLLASAARPIVLVARRAGAAVAGEVAPGRRELGLMLPYTPLHYLLLRDLEMPLVMTSGNRSDEPIAYRDEDAIARLGAIADGILTHNRPIEARCEDSVARVVRIGGIEQTLMLRRSRGYVPEPIPLPIAAEAPILATGGQLKNTVCIARQQDAIVGPHGGDLSDAIAFSAYARGVDHMVGLSGTSPVIVAHDLHPEYLSTKYALDRTDLGAAGVQHHHAHFAACLAEHHHMDRAIGLIFDGAGHGTDGTVWGGEILCGDLGGSDRVGHLRPVALPGGDAAVRKPWRMACAWLTAVHEAEPLIPIALQASVQPQQWSIVSRIAITRDRCPVTTSVGRLLDACAAICGVRPRVTYEGQAAIDFESIARRGVGEAYGCVVYDRDPIIIDPHGLILAVEGDANGGRDSGVIAALVHNGLVCAAALAAQVAAERAAAQTVVLSGGVFQNVLILEALAAALTRRGLHVLVPRLLPPNDGGLSYGQAVVAAWQGRHRVLGDSGSSH